MKPVIMISIKPKYVKEILNGNKTIEIRKRFPKDFVGWVYIYCTKVKPCLAKSNETKTGLLDLNGKVVARFWCDNVEEIDHWYSIMPSFKQTCLSQSEFADYIGNKIGYAIHITNLQILDKPSEISKFMKVSCKGCPFENTQTCHNNTDGRYCKLTRAPQSYCYVEDNL